MFGLDLNLVARTDAENKAAGAMAMVGAERTKAPVMLVPRRMREVPTAQADRMAN